MHHASHHVTIVRAAANLDVVSRMEPEAELISVGAGAGVRNVILTYVAAGCAKSDCWAMSRFVIDKSVKYAHVHARCKQMPCQHAHANGAWARVTPSRAQCAFLELYIIRPGADLTIRFVMLYSWSHFEDTTGSHEPTYTTRVASHRHLSTSLLH